MQKSQWKFSKLRPIGFPTVRLAQLVAVLTRETDIFRRVLTSSSIENVVEFLQQEPNSYWQTHYRFDKVSNQKSKVLSDSFAEIILINALIPTLFFYGKATAKNDYCEKAISWIESMVREKNSIITAMRKAGFKIENAAQSQAALQLYKSHCQRRKCLSCAIGVKLLKQ